MELEGAKLNYLMTLLIKTNSPLSFADSSDIVDCKLKLILGLIWTLILHYSISMPDWEGDDDQSNATPKQR